MIDDVDGRNKRTAKRQTSRIKVAVVSREHVCAAMEMEGARTNHEADQDGATPQKAGRWMDGLWKG